MILTPGTVLCDCNRGVAVYLQLDTEAETPADTSAAIAGAYVLAAFVARLTAVARGWAVRDMEAVCELCVDRPDVGTVYQAGDP